MLSCWELEAKERPKFSDLVVTVNNLLERDAGYLELSVSPTTTMRATLEPVLLSPSSRQIEKGKSMCGQVGYCKVKGVDKKTFMQGK